MTEVIRKEENEIVLYSSDGEKVLGRFPFGEGKKYADEEAAREAARKRERQIQFFKHQGESLGDEIAALRERRHHSAAWHSCWEKVKAGTAKTPGLPPASAAAVCTWSIQRPPNPPEVYEALKAKLPPTVLLAEADILLSIDDAWALDPLLGAEMEAKGILALKVNTESWEIEEIPGDLGPEPQELSFESVQGMLERREILEVGARHTQAEQALIDKVLRYLEIIRDGEITAEEAEELRSLGIIVRATQEAEEGFESKAQRVRDAWYAANRSPLQAPERPEAPWPTEVYEDHIIVRGPDGYYSIGYAEGEDAITFDPPEKWVRVLQVWQPVETPAAESIQEASIEHVTTLTEARMDDAGNLDCVLIEAGESANGNVYTPEVLEAALPHFVGAQMFVDHPARSEEKDRPERSVRDLVGKIVEARMDGSRVRARAQISQADAWLKTLISEGIAGDLSINAQGRGRKEKDKFVVEAITAVRSVDFVTRAAAKGRVLEVLESCPPPAPGLSWEALTIEALSEHCPDVLNAIASREKDKVYAGRDEVLAEAQAAPQLREELAEKQKRISELEGQLEARAVADVVEETLRESHLPAPAQGAIRERMVKVSLADAPARLEALIQEQKQLVAAILEAGRVSGHGGSVEGHQDGEQAHAALVEAFERLGYTHEQALDAAKGRARA